MYMKETLVYFELCHELEMPDLDPRWLIDQLDEVQISGELQKILTKVNLIFLIFLI